MRDTELGTATTPEVSRWLAIYLRNHASAAHAGVEEFARAARGQARRPWGGDLAGLASDVREDCESLTALLAACDVRPDHWSTSVVRLGERVGRLKPNGRLVRRSPLSDLMEVEAGLDAVHAKAAGWQALRASGVRFGAVDLDELSRRAADQVARLQDVHATVASSVL